MEDISKRGRNTNTLKKSLIGCFITLIIIVVLMTAGIYFGSKKFVAYGISSDITEYISFIDKSDLDVYTKKDLRYRLENLRDLARKGQLIGFWVWLDYDKSITNLIEDGKITENDLASLKRELERLETHNDKTINDIQTKHY